MEQDQQPQIDRLELVWGVRAIAQEINVPWRRAQYLCETAQIPVGKVGRHYVANRSTLREHFAKLTSDAA